MNSMVKGERLFRKSYGDTNLTLNITNTVVIKSVGLSPIVNTWLYGAATPKQFEIARQV